MYKYKFSITLVRNGLCFSTSNIFRTKKLGRIMNKLMGNPNKKKLLSSNISLPRYTDKLIQTEFGATVTGSPRRASVLNKLFMRNITDVMTVSEYSEEIRKYGIEFERIKITPDYKILKVYWTSGRVEDGLPISKLLHKCSGFLRHELSQLHLMGQIPVIVFVRDRNYFKAIQVQDRILEISDQIVYNEAINDADNLRCNDRLHNEINTDGKSNELVTETIEFSDLNKIPAMPQNVLGLNHSRILNRIKQTKSASEINKEGMRNDWAKFKLEQHAVSNPIQYANNKEQREVLNEFLHKRQIQRNKQRKNEKNLTADREYFEEKSKLDYMQLLEDPGELYEEDCIDEDTNEHK